MKRWVQKRKENALKKRGIGDSESRWSLERTGSQSSRSSQERSSQDRSVTSLSLDNVRSSVERLNPLVDDQTYIAKVVSKARKGQVSIPELLDELMSLTEVLSADTHHRLCVFLAETENIKKVLLLLTGQAELDIAEPPKEEMSVRERYRYNWICATLISCGPKELREPIARNPALVEILVNFYETTDGRDDAVTSHVTRAVSSVLHMKPAKFTELLFEHSTFAPSLVRLVGSGSIADLLPRFVSERDLKTRSPFSFGPPVKRSIIAFGQYKLFEALADQFEQMSAKPLPQDFWTRNVQENTATAMGSICIRAMMIPGYNNRVEPAPHTFGAMVRELDLLAKPNPYIRILRAALTSYKERHYYWALCSALSALSSVLDVFRLGRESDSVVVLRQVQNLNSSELEEAICGCLDSLTPLLQANRKVPTRLRVDVMQFIVNLLRVGKKSTVVEVCRRGTLSDMLDLFFHHENSDVLHRLVRDAVQSAMERNIFEFQLSWFRDTSICSKMLEQWDLLELDRVHRGAAEVGSRPSYAGDVIDIVIVVRTFLRRCPDKSAQFEELVGKESYAKFVDLCNRRLPPVEEYRSPQVRKQKKFNRSSLFPVVGGSEPDFGEGDGDRIYYQGLIDNLRAESRGEESAWSPLLEFVSSMSPISNSR